MSQQQFQTEVMDQLKMEQSKMTSFAELRKINVNDKTETKNGLTYLSWAWAVDTLLQQDPTATWFYGEPVKFNDTLMVFCTVTAFGKSMTAQLPVIDFRNKAIPNPDAMAVNTGMQRCLAKAIALHGIGLYIYSGEDLPEPEDKTIEYGETLTAAAEKGEAELHKVWLKIATEMGKEKAAKFWAINGAHFKELAKGAE
ncbi:Single-strand annealing protein SAK3 [uncultured Caudovirales phage]|uniref:Single-strand annealing protein SAK3 n=1 Tax=uncultured Caudovirales phage TaxID=2100421 RepID=A0A6J7WFC0_9CAUD|nr:Single-strand annealing protein SAK3 [uncultured Caudovirales phage]